MLFLKQSRKFNVNIGEENEYRLQSTNKIYSFLQKNIKYLYKDMLISCIFILLSSTTPVLSLSNSAWFVLLWYVMSVGLLLILNWIETCCNVQNKIKRKLLKKYHYRKNLTSKEKKRIVRAYLKTIPQQLSCTKALKTIQ